MNNLDSIRAIVTAWRNDTELSAARAMYEIAGLLGVEPPAPVGGKTRRGKAPEQPTRTEPMDENRHETLTSNIDRGLVRGNTSTAAPIPYMTERARNGGMQRW